MSTTPLVLRYPLDRTGVNPTNLVVGEEHELLNRKTRAIATRYGPFYSKSVKITDLVTNEDLVQGVDFHCVEYYELPSAMFGKEICAIILLVEPNKSRHVKVTYQAVGGEFSYSNNAIARMIEALNNDDRPVNWPDIINLPPGFNPAPHLHDIGDVIGFEYLVQALDNLSYSIITGDAASHDEILKYIDGVRDQVFERVEEVENDLLAHTHNENNPHNVNKGHVGLGSVENYAMATDDEAKAGVLRTAYMSPRATKEAIDAQIRPLVVSHIGDQNNPHRVNKGHVGLGSVENLPVATKAQAEAGTSNLVYMTSLRTKEAIDAQIRPMLTGHTTDYNNPHRVNKGHVGLGNVQNYSVSTKALAEGGVDNASYMTPLRTKEAIDAQIRPLVNSHVTNKNNPHEVNKNHVGLGNIPNSITSSRNTNSEASLLTAKGMFDHVASGDHDGRYVRHNAATSCSIREINGTAQIFINNGWRQFWPPLWQ